LYQQQSDHFRKCHVSKELKDSAKSKKTTMKARNIYTPIRKKHSSFSKHFS